MSIEDWFLVFVVLFAILSFMWGMFLGMLCGPGDLDFAGYWDWYFRVCNARVP
ncbi:ORF1C [Fowl aviadenovirus D]|uniref:ORF1C n=1 Tax=Fowl aviadenovirus D TaxID=190064 RepID=UPI00001D975E|nr:ORF1C [Fowl aviadenovirus D]